MPKHKQKQNIPDMSQVWSKTQEYSYPISIDELNVILADYGFRIRPKAKSKAKQILRALCPYHWLTSACMYIIQKCMPKHKDQVIYLPERQS